MRPSTAGPTSLWGDDREREFANGQRLGRTAWDAVNVSVIHMSPQDRRAFLMGFAAGATEDINERIHVIDAEHSTHGSGHVINLRDFPWVVPEI